MDTTQYIRATKMLLPYLEAIKNEHDLEKRKEFAKTAVEKIVGSVDETSEIFVQILKRVNAIHADATHPISKEILDNFYTYDLNNISDLNLKAIMMVSREKNVKIKFGKKIFLSCLTSDELNILSTAKKGSSENVIIKPSDTVGGRKKSRKLKF